MHDFEDNYRNQRKFRVRGKWELVLVVLVVTAGVVVTTIAILKAKEKRDIQSHQLVNSDTNDNLQVINSKLPRFVAIDSSSQNHVKRKVASGQVEPLDRAPKQNRNQYRAEKEFTDYGGYGSESRKEESKELASGEWPNTQKPYRVRGKNHDSSGSYPLSKPMMVRHDGLPGYPAPPDFDPNVYLLQSSKNNHQPPPNVELSANSAGFVLSDMVPVDIAASEEISHKIPHQSDNNGPPVGHQRNQMTAFSQANGQNSALNRMHMSKDIFKLAGMDTGNYISQNELIWLQQARPELFQPNVMHAPHHRQMRKKRDLTRRKRRRQLVELEEDDGDDDGNDRKTVNNGRYHQTKKTNNRKNRYLSRYVASNEDDDEDNRDHKVERTKNQEMSQKRPQNKNRTKASQKTKHKNRYTKEESKKVEKYDILGSGNFEIIRGGILDKFPVKKSPTISKSRMDNDETSGQKKKLNKTRTDGAKNLSEENSGEENEEDNGSKENDDDGENFEPFNFDLFGNDPILGFQGYDNFDSSKNDITKVRI